MIREWLHKHFGRKKTLTDYRDSPEYKQLQHYLGLVCNHDVTGDLLEKDLTGKEHCSVDELLSFLLLSSTVKDSDLRRLLYERVLEELVLILKGETTVS